MTEAPEADRKVGMLVYGTQGEPCAGKTKSAAEDFEVTERVELEGMVQDRREGYFPLYRVEKRSIDTLHLAREVEATLKSRVSFGGLKDKRSASTQYFTPTSRRAKVLEELKGERYSARVVGYVPAPMGRSAVLGNEFRIVLRGCCEGVGERVEEAFAAARDRRIPNFYGMQRFGARSASHRIGKAIVQRRFEEAVDLILSGEERPVDEKELRGLAGGQGPMDVERLVARALLQSPGKWIASLRAVPIKLRRLYVNAYQSYLFNLTLSGAIEDGEDISRFVVGDNWGEEEAGGLRVAKPMGVHDTPSNSPVPLVQLMGYSFRDYGSRFDRELLRAARDEGVEAKEFYVEEMQEVSAEGGFRRPHQAFEGGTVDVEGGNATLGFSLGKGMYATVLLREVMKPSDPEAAGLG